MASCVLEAADLRRIVQERVILSSISFQVSAGEVLFVFGPPRAGKTHLLRCLALLDPLQVGAHHHQQHRHRTPGR